MREANLHIQTYLDHETGAAGFNDCKMRNDAYS
jgi:hypothetical protein